LQDGVELGGGEGRHARLEAGLARAHGVARDPHHAIALTQPVEGLGGLFGEADDAAGKINRQAWRPPPVSAATPAPHGAPGFGSGPHTSAGLTRPATAYASGTGLHSGSAGP